MKTAQIFALFSYITFSIASDKAFSKAIEASKFDFAYSVEGLKSGDFLYHYSLSAQGLPSNLKKSNSHYNLVSTALGVADVSKDKIYSLILRVVYVIDKPLETFVRNETLNDVEFLNHVMGGDLAQKISNNTFNIAKKDVTPGYTTTRDLLTSSLELSDHYGANVGLLPVGTLINKTIAEPVFMLQNSTDFTKVLNVKSSKMARNLTAYYKVENNKIIVDSYTLVHLYNVPPNMIGGTARLKKDYIQAIQDSINREITFQP